MALDCTVPPVWLVPTGGHLIYFLIWNLSYSPSSEPSRTALFLDVMYSTDPHQLRKSFSPSWAAPSPPGPLHLLLGCSISSVDCIDKLVHIHPNIISDVYTVHKKYEMENVEIC